MRVGFLALALFMALPAAAQTSGYAGTWEVAVREAGHRNFYLPMIDGRLVIAADGRSARYNGLALTWAESRAGLRLDCHNGAKACGFLLLSLDGDRLSGSGTLVDADGLDRPVTLSGSRPIPARAPRTIDYEPTEFHNFYSPDIPAVLHLQPGDTLSTSSLDSRGYDRGNRPRAPRGNPLTGPFYIDGAMPGDTLVVHLERIRTNRDSAYQANLVASTALETAYAGAIAASGGGFSRWHIDAGAGTASLLDATGRLAGYSVRLDPMLGCVGVAPPRDETLASGHLGAFGGNMDSQEVREGTTLYLPVFQPGALLSLGDGHAAQGDGELPGQGLETSMDIQVRIELIPGQALGQPRLESADAVMIMGTGVTLDAAMKNATTQMSRWLADAYGLNPNEIAALLGTALKYEIAEVVDAEFNVVAKLGRDDLAKIRRLP